MNNGWSVDELEACVVAYLRMLSMEISGEKYSKAEVNKYLRKDGLNRTKASIEYRMQNLSSFFMEMKVPTIPGYKPSANIGKNVFLELQKIVERIRGETIWKDIFDAETIDPLSVIRGSLAEHRSDLDEIKIDQKAKIIFDDLVLLARCACSKCLLSYEDAIKLRGRGIALNGQWLDEVYSFAIDPLGLHDLTVLIVKKGTNEPSHKIFDARRTLRSKLSMSEIAMEQKRCIWDNQYENLLGKIDKIPKEYWVAGRILSPQPAIEKEILRASRNASNRAALAGVEKKSVGKVYPDTLPMPELINVVERLWKEQKGRCVLTGTPFEIEHIDNGGIHDDRISLDRIDNDKGYSANNIQLVTQFANRARGTLSSKDAKNRLVQWS